MIIKHGLQSPIHTQPAKLNINELSIKVQCGSDLEKYLLIYSNMFIPFYYIRVNTNKISSKSDQIEWSFKVAQNKVKRGKNTNKMALILVTNSFSHNFLPFEETPMTPLLMAISKWAIAAIMAIVNYWLLRPVSIWP